MVEAEFGALARGDAQQEARRPFRAMRHDPRRREFSASWISIFFLLGQVWILDMLFPQRGRKRQTLHEKVAGSVVLTGRPAG